MKKIFISDVTLAKTIKGGLSSFTFKEKTNIAKSLDMLGVDSIELSPLRKDSREDEISAKTLAQIIKNCCVKIPAGTCEEEIARAYNCVKYALDPCLQIVLPTSVMQMEYKYHIKPDVLLNMAKDLCEKARKLCEKVEFVAKDASRTDIEFLAKVCKAACESGACSVTLCDDAGVMLPRDFAAMTEKIKAECKGAFIFAETSDAISMAAACALSAIGVGADGVKTSVFPYDGLSLDTFANILHVKGTELCLSTRLDITAANKVCSDIVRKAGVSAQAAQENAENPGANVKLNKDSTIEEVSALAASLGYELPQEDLGKVYNEFLRVSGKKEYLGARELDAIIASSAMQVPSAYHIESYVLNSGNIINATANIVLVRDGEKLRGMSTGDGPIDAAFHAIEQIIGHHYELDDFQIQAVTEGREAVGSAVIKLRSGGKLYSGNGISTDIVGASIRAYINALNKIVYGEN